MRRSERLVLLLIFLAAPACKGADTAVANAARQQQLSVHLPTTAVPSPPPWAPPDVASEELCRAPLNACLLLWQVPVEQASETWCNTCQVAGCQRDWLVSAARSHRELDYARNCIYALHGYIFKTPEMQAQLADKPWYQPRVGWQDSEFSVLERANIKKLKQLEKTRRREHQRESRVSAGDRRKVRSWFRALKSGTFEETPERLLAHNEPIAREEFLRALPAWLQPIENETVDAYTLDSGNRMFSIGQNHQAGEGETSYVISFEVDPDGALVAIEYMIAE